MLGWPKSTGVRIGTLSTLEDALRTVRELARFSQVAAEFMTGLSRLPILQGTLVTVTTDGTTNQNYFAHGMARPFMGAILLGQNIAPAPITLLSPAAVLNGPRDPSLVFGSKQAVAAAVTFSAWVF